jgi:uncharacterized protein YxjI
MPITAVCECGKDYTLKDEFAGKSIKCPACSSTFVVPASSRIAQADPIFDRDKFLIKQKRIAISAKYFVGDEQGREIAFVHRPAAIGRVLLIILLSMVWIMVVSLALTAIVGPPGREKNAFVEVTAPFVILGGIFGICYLLAPLRHVTFYRDRAMKEVLMTVRQDFRMALFNAKYTLLDAAGEPLVRFRKNYLYNVFRKRWYVEQLDGSPFCLALEESILLSILRRLLGPMFGLLRTNFIITTDDGTDVLGEFNRKLTIFDKYVLDLTEDPDRTLDRRVALALGVMLDTGERR